MSEGAQNSTRVPLLLLIAADLVLLALRLGPMQQIFTLPGKGNIGIDPALCLLACGGVVLWLTGANGSRLVYAQRAVTWLGVAGGAILGGRFWMAGLQSGPQTREEQSALLVVLCIVWGFAGVRATREAGTKGASLMAGVWSGLVSALIAATAVLGQFFVTGPPPETQDSYKQFQEMGIGDPATVVLVHALSAVPILLLLGPLASAAMAIVFSQFAGKRATSAE
jgi:hypothetical protein